MKKKSAVLYSLPSPMLTEGCDLVIRAGELLRKPKTNEIFCHFDIIGLQDCSLSSVTLTLSFFNGQKKLLGDSQYVFTEISLLRGQSIGEKDEVPVPYKAARSFTARISSITDKSGKELLFSEDDVIILSGRRLLEDALGDPELAEQFRVRYGADCRYLRSEQAGLWFCVCGCINKSSDRSCPVCHRARKALTDVNLDSLRAEASVRIKNENSAPSETAREGIIKKLFTSRHFIFLIPIILLFVLLLAAAPGALSREYRYRDAVKAMDAGDYDTAESIFVLLPSYRDSDTLAYSEIPYLRAKALMDAAEVGDLSALADAGYSEEELDERTTASSLLYSAAADAFDALGNYKDSAELAEGCRSSFENEQRKLLQIDYDAANALLAQKKYCEASLRFQDLGKYSDSEKMVLECLYQKAVALFHFLSSYDVSRISAHISTDPYEVSIFSIPKEEALRLGSGCIDELRAACGNDPSDIRLEDDTPEELQSLKDALTELFRSLGDYADSASYPDRISEETDYTREFFMLCGTGDLNGALDWLNSYEGDFPEKEKWEDLISLYLPFCRSWSLYLGDSTLVPYSIGQSFSCMSVSSRVLLSAKNAVLRLSFGSGNKFTFDLSAEPGETSFRNTEPDSGIYVAYINNAGHLGYERYDSDWKSLSACEYE